MENNSFEKVKSDGTNSEWDMSEIEYIGAEENETNEGQNEVNDNSKETIKEQDLASLKNIFPKVDGEDEDDYKKFIISFYDLVPRQEGESADEYSKRMMEDYLEDNNKDKDGENRWEAFTKGTEEADKLKEDDSLFLFLTSADGGYAVKKEEAVDVFIEKVENADDGKKFNDAKMLAIAIQNDKSKFSEDDIKKLTDYMQTPAYQKKLFTDYIEQSKKTIEKKNEALQRCLDEVERKKKGGLFNKFSNRKAIKEAEDRVQWAKNGIKEAEETLLYYSAKLKELENGGGVSTEQLAEQFTTGNNKAA